MNNADAPQADEPTPLILVDNLERSFNMGQQTVHVINGITMTIQRGEMVAIIGASGAGKSTLLHILGTWIAQRKEKCYLKAKTCLPSVKLLWPAFEIHG